MLFRDYLINNENTIIIANATKLRNNYKILIFVKIRVLKNKVGQTILV
jgi:hypothetical protein